MDRDLFKKLLNGNTRDNIHHYTKEEMVKLLEKSVDSTVCDVYPKGYRQLIISIEELSELIKEITKELRGEGDYAGIIEELADAIICTEYIKSICKISDYTIEKAIDIKLNNFENRMTLNNKIVK